MNKIHVLDCTLRDGGYCNQWKFGCENIKKIVNGLVEANVDIIECGFLTNRVVYDSNVTKFTSLSEVSRIIPENRTGRIFVVMMNYGEYDIDEIPEYDGASVDGIRVAFHRQDMEQALIVCEKIQKKGYKVFVQAMVSMSYTDEQFLHLIQKVNDIEPYSFYIVDSFGMMKQRDLIRLFYMIEHNLKEKIWIGFHSHNNMQLAYSNAQGLVNIQTNRNLIIDASVYGMGRGAGNLNTELFVDYLNENMDKSYEMKPLLNIIDEILNDFYQKNYWGYSLPNYLSAIHNAHPNYAGYLDDKKTLTVKDMNEIFDMMSYEKRFEYDKEYIESLYEKYMNSGKTKEEHINEIKKRMYGKKVLLIAPGKSSYEEREKISEYSMKNDVVTISINVDYAYGSLDYIFVSNLRRFREMDINKHCICIVTSNIHTEDVYLTTNYNDLTNDIESVKDNAGMMAIKFLISLGVKEVILAGFDGYSHDIAENYADNQLEIISKNEILDLMNEGMKKVLSQLGQEIEIRFLTKSKYK